VLPNEQGNVQLLLDLFVDRAGDAHSAGFCEPLQTRRDIDTISVEPIAFYGHIAHVDTDAELHPPLRR
jgi:hypothetical protein